MTQSAERGSVTVYGRDIRIPPLVESADAEMVLIRDAFGDPMMLLVRMSDDVWGLSTRGDEDWNAMLVRYGFATLAPGTRFQDIVAHGVEPFVEKDHDVESKATS